MSDDKRILIERYLHAYNAFDIDGMLATLHDDIEFSNVSRGERNVNIVGKEQFRHLAEHARRLFSSRRLTALSYRLDVEPVIVEMRLSGVIAFDLPDGLSRGETLELDGRSEFAFRNGLICRILDIR